MTRTLLVDRGDSTDSEGELLGAATFGPLGEEGIVTRDLAERVKGWMGFRNVLVHFYLGIDHQRTYDAIQNDLGDLSKFAAQMARLLEE